jgi:hypothetical protein
MEPKLSVPFDQLLPWCNRILLGNVAPAHLKNSENDQILTKAKKIVHAEVLVHINTEQMSNPWKKVS